MQLRRNNSGSMKLRVGVRLGNEKCARTVEVGLHTKEKAAGVTAAIIAARILSMVGIGESVWTLRDEDGNIVDTPELAAIISDSKALRPANQPPILDGHVPPSIPKKTPKRREKPADKQGILPGFVRFFRKFPRN